MCGIVGFITTESKLGEVDRSKFLKQALIVDTLRGDDSTGIFGVAHESRYETTAPYWFKQVGAGHDFVDSKEYWENFYDVEEYRCVVGHNRAATMGSVDAKNAHPFSEGPITLVHNGTLTSTHVLPSPMSSFDGVTVDSHAIAHNLATHSVEDVVENLYGAFALVWHDGRDDSVNVVRNTKRPLHFALGQDGKTLFFMSEGEMLHMLGNRCRLGLKDIYYPTEGQFLKWGPDTPLDSPEVKELDLYEDRWPSYNTTGSGYVSGYNSGGYQYDWRDDVDYGYNSPGKSVARSETENYLLLGGRRQAIPMLLQEALLEHDVTVEDRLRFTMQSSGLNMQDSERVYVTGVVEGTHKAILYNCHRTTVATRASEDWTVRVIGVKLDGHGEPWFICKLMSTFVNPVQLTSNNGGTCIVDDKGRAMMGYKESGMVPGRDGLMISASDFYTETADGCVMCRKIVPWIDAYDIVWVDEGPICPNCDERLYEAQKGE
jgi:hypothetical protein